MNSMKIKLAWIFPDVQYTTYCLGCINQQPGKITTDVTIKYNYTIFRAIPLQSLPQRHGSKNKHNVWSHNNWIICSGL